MEHMTLEQILARAQALMTEEVEDDEFDAAAARRRQAIFVWLWALLQPHINKKSSSGEYLKFYLKKKTNKYFLLERTTLFVIPFIKIWIPSQEMLLGCFLKTAHILLFAVSNWSTCQIHNNATDSTDWWK